MKLEWPDRYGDEVLDYQVDWRAALGEDDEITGAVTAEPSAGSGLEVENISTSEGITTVWLSGGGVYPKLARVHLSASTVAGRTISASVSIRISAIL